MAKKNRKENIIDRTERVFLVVTNGFFTLLAKLGIPGIAIFLIAYFASKEQKEKIIDKWVLFEGGYTGATFGIACFSVCLIVILSQAYYFRKEKKLMLKELSRKEVEIEKLQKLLLGKTKKK